METTDATTRTPADGAVVAWLADNDASCPACEYSLRSIPTPVCPECGAKLGLTIDAPGLSHRPWVGAVIAVALGLGFDGVFALILGIVVVMNPPPSGFRGPYLVLGGMTVAAVLSAAGLLLVLRARHRWLRRSNRTQWRWAVLVTAVVAILHAAIGVFFIDSII